MSTMVLLRHGQAMFGSSNYDRLTPHGEKQASACADFWRSRGTTFTRVVVGPCKRHLDTVRLAVEGLRAPDFEFEPLLNEFADATPVIKAAEARTGADLSDASTLPKSEIARIYGEQIRLWSDHDVPMEGVESIGEFRQRVARWLTSMTASGEPGQHVLVSTSGGVICAVLAEILGLSNVTTGSLMWSIENCSLTGIAWSQKGLSLRYFNQTAHLPAGLTSGM